MTRSPKSLTAARALLALSLACLGGPVADAASSRKIDSYRKALLEDKAVEGLQEVRDLYVVDCLLPGKVRRLGNTTYLGPRRPIRTTAADCRLKGGEYTAYDRADYRSALRVWMASAEEGNAEAQVHVGEIFERGLGGEPNYEAAHTWYSRAAKQGNTRAQFALGTLYEQGLGVPPSRLEALNWYRRAWGIEEDSLMYESAVQREAEQAAATLEAEILERDEQIALMNEQLASLRDDLGTADKENADAQTRLKTLTGLITLLEAQKAAHRSELSDLQAQIEARAVPAPQPGDPLLLREPASPEDAATATGGARDIRYEDLSLGGYYALLIGNSDYERLEDLQTPINDIARARNVLENKYGFTVFSLDNGNSIEIMQAINNLADIVTENDNLLIFFAGHGSRLQTGRNEAGYWLPKNAERPPRNTFWVSNEFVSGHLARLNARRVLVVADSCYAGLLAGDPSLALMGVDSPQYTNPEFLEFKLSKRARLLLSSGGDKPVLDQGSGNHSIFANAFLSALEANEGLLATPQLYLQIQQRVEDNAAAFGFAQSPELKSIKSAGHEVGDFFFLAQPGGHRP